MRKRGGVVRIVDVARHAGVAPSTVYYVLTGKRPISSGTKSKVRESIRALDYRPHTNDGVPWPARTNVIGLVSPHRAGLQWPMMTRLVAAAVMTARGHGMDVLLITVDDDAPGLRKVMGRTQADGYVVMDVEAADEWLQLPTPSVLIGRSAVTNGATCADIDLEAASARCVDHLFALGHRTIGFLGAPGPVYRYHTGFAHRIMTGFSAAAMRRGISVTITPTGGERDSVLTAVKALIRLHPSMTALVVHNEAALGWVTGCLRASGRSVPRDVAVIAICPDELAERMSPPLTSVRLPVEQLGARAVELLMCRLTGREVVSPVLLQPDLVVRASTPGAVIGHRK